MRLLPTLVLVVSLCISVPIWAQDEVPFDASSETTEAQIIAFVGKKVFVERDDNFPPKRGDPEYDENIIHMDERYQARYDIVEIIYGDFTSSSIDLVAYDHYGEPRFSEKEGAVLLFVHDGPTGRVHSKYNYYEVHPTTDGDWAACGNAYVQNDTDRRQKEPLEAISFLDPVEVDVPSLFATLENFLDADEVVSDAEAAELQAEFNSENAEVDGLYQAPIWKREGSKATCQMGTRVADLFKFQNETRFLPDRWHDTCNTELGYSANILIGSGSHPTMQAQKDAEHYKICIERERFKSLEQ